MNSAGKDALQTPFEEGHAAWPELALSEETFARHLAALASHSARPTPLFAADLYLACAAAQGEPRAITAVMQRLRAEATRALLRIDPSPAFLEEVLQTLQVELLVSDGKAAPRISTYRAEGSLAAWLRASAVRLGLKLRSPREEELSLIDQTAASSPELELIKARYRGEFERCFAEELAQLPKRSRSLLRLHYVDGLGIDQLGAIYHVGRSSVARWLARERQVLIDGLRKRLTEQLGIAAPELASLMKLVASQLHVTLSRALE